MFGSLFRCGGLLCKVQSDIILLPLIEEGLDGEFPVRNRQCVTSVGGEVWAIANQARKGILPILPDLNRFPLRVQCVLINMFNPLIIRPIMRLWIEFRVTKKVVARSDKRIGCSPPYPSPSWRGYLAPHPSQVKRKPTEGSFPWLGKAIMLKDFSRLEHCTLTQFLKGFWG